MSLPRKQTELIARLLLIEDPAERLDAILARGRRWPAPPPASCTEAALVRGCTSRVWLVGTLAGGRCRFAMQAEAPLVQGLAALLCELYDGETPAVITAFEPNLLNPLGLDPHISPQRRHGFAQIQRTLRAFAAQAQG